MHLYQGIRMCLQCSGECVIWQESVDEQPWEKVRSRYPFLLYLLCSPCPLWFAVSLSRSTAYCFPENLQGLTETALWLWIVEPIGIQVFLVTFTDDWSNITWYGSYTQQIERYPFFIPVHTCVREKYSCAYIVIYPFCICSSPLKVKEDDEVDKLEININNPKRSKRTYASPSPEVAMKISRSLKVIFSTHLYTCDCTLSSIIYMGLQNLYAPLTHK